MNNLSPFDNHTWLDKPKEKPIKPTPKNCRSLPRPKPKTYSYHHSNPNSQNALICETRNFPDYYNPQTHEISGAYSDRLREWDNEHFKKTCALGKGSDCVWSSRLPKLSPQKLKKFAKHALKLDTLPTHVRIIHHFNVASGYSCPTVTSICKIKKEHKK